ncbi:MAG TPA: nicotinate-nicotinamide nucleotide adenylyltransferase [Myxococcota bacterium]|nr:nicotinate-nicotinamide nucleotide adenylyltransferase [Myxococcota bacterium]
MRIGVYGGSFHPPHVGHGLVAAWLGWTRRVDEVWLVPVGGHAFGKELAPFADRVRWCEALAAEVGPWVRVSAIEGQLPVPSYTVQTLDALAARHPEHGFQLVIGADILPDVPRWRDWGRIERAYPPIVVGRGGYPDVPGSPTFPAVSSTAIRAALARGEPVDHLVPAAVRALLPAPPGPAAPLGDPPGDPDYDLT